MHARLKIFVVLVLLLLPGCSEPFTAYHSTGGQRYGEYVAGGGTILVMPFMDSRTFVDKSDPHRMDLGSHARTIFVAAMRDAGAGADAAIITPRMPQPMKSLTNAEVAEIGRRHGADVVVAGQVFSFTGTRAASIPPRAGMFVRVISARDGALLFVGDHYQAATIPGSPGGRELQARQVSDRLVEGLLSRSLPAGAVARGISSAAAMAMLAELPFGSGAAENGNGGGKSDDGGGGENAGDGGTDSGSGSEPGNPGILEFVDTAAAAIIDELPEIDLATVDPNMIPADAPPTVAAAWKLTGDELAEDLFASNGAVEPSLEPSLEPSAGEFGAGGAEIDPDALAVSESRAEVQPKLDVPLENGPLVSVPLAVEQPHTFKSVNRQVQEVEGAERARESETAAEEAPALSADAAKEGGIRVLMLPYHDLPNENNLIPNTGGGEVVTALFGTHLAMDSGLAVLWDGSGQATHDRLLTREEAVLTGRQAGADYVVRGQVVEFRRAQSVPSFYSAMISTAVLAAQIFFAEMSGVDVATEVYRVSDGLCVMSRRDRSQQKYVVQAEKTVRRMADTIIGSIGAVVRLENPEAMDPLIDGLSPEPLLTDAQPQANK